LVDETLESLASGIVYFNKEGHIEKFNSIASILIPELNEKITSRKFIGSYSKFLSFVYDRSLDIRDQTKRDLDTIYLSNSKLLSREIAKLNNKTILLQFYQRTLGDIVTIMTDISMFSRNIEKMAALTEENEIIVRAFEATGNGMLIAKKEGTGNSIIFANNKFCTMLSQSSEKVIKGYFPLVLEPCFSSQMISIQEGIDRAQRSNEVTEVSLRLRPDKKTVLWYVLYILFFKDGKDQEFYVCILSDQTQLRLTQAKVFQAQKLDAVAQMIGGLAHDFNNILSIIEGYSRIIRRSLDKGEDVNLHFENIDRSVKRGIDLTSRLLDFGQYRRSEKIRLNICDHIREMEAFLAPLAGSDIRLIISAQETACHVEVAPESITQIIISLVTNAREAMPGGGDLIVSIADASQSQLIKSQKKIEKKQSYICLQVIDSGRGMDHEVLARIYEPFFTTKDNTMHSGLGVSLVYGLVKEMNAMIDIKSNPGVGTSISILIPKCDAVSISGADA
ncbi:MAG: hypothetical protein DI586_11150, partial [Micavibrio aeruginosavorus]